MKVTAAGFHHRRPRLDSGIARLMRPTPPGFDKTRPATYKTSHSSVPRDVTVDQGNTDVQYGAAPGLEPCRR